MNASHVMHAYRALLPSGWASNVNFTISDGLFQKIDVDATPTGNAVRVGTVIAGVANLHSHAFQRSLAGMSERRDGSADTFMSWRSAMYSALDRLTPDLFEDICTYVYARMVLFGYTNVAEFHYVHRDKKGVLYDNPAELSIRAVRAARNAGIGTTHLPVIYRYGGFNRQALSPQQARMECAPEMAFTIAESVKSAFKSDVAVSVGLAPHSLRAVDHSGMDQIAKMAKSLSPNAPVHLHVSEQVDEVRQCVAHYGKNPIELLAASTTLDQRWVLVHCTHATEQDFKLIADANACVALCPMTEANLGDGHVNLSAMLTAKCRYGIGSDSQVALAPKVEWLMLEYSQRLLKRERNVASVSGMSVGRTLLEASSQSAEHALGRPTGKFALGYQADMVELEVMDPAFVGIEDDRILDAWIFAADRSVVSNVMVAGDWIVKSGVHRNEQPLRQRYEAALRRLRG